MPKPGMPYADTPFTEYLSKQIDIASSRGKNQRQIAKEVGYDKPNMISMFKRGETKVPFEKIPALAKALGADPAFVCRLAMQQYWPDNASVIAAIFGRVLTKNEVKIIDAIRAVSKGADPELTEEQERKLAEIFD